MKINELLKKKEEITTIRNKEIKDVQNEINALINKFENRVKRLFKNINIEILHTYNMVEVYIGEETILEIRDNEVEINNGVSCDAIEKIKQLHKDIY